MAADDPAFQAHVLARIRALQAQAPRSPAVDLTVAARQVVLVGSSSRGGSSIFAELLRRSGRMVHFRGEINHVLRLHGLVQEASDGLSVDEPVPAGLGVALGEECGRPTADLGGDAGEWRFAMELAVRLTLQWPDLRFSVEEVHDALQRALAALRRDEGWPAGRFVEAQALHARLLGLLRVTHPEIHPAAYDLDRRRIEAHCPGPYPDPFVPVRIVEEPPFVLVTPWLPADEAMLASGPLVIKTPSNAYRLAWMRRLFGGADVRMLHLVRNVAASVNGLVDGWLHPGFHSHRCPDGLSIRGYSDRVPGGASWWKFDRPPGWQALASSPLEAVCAFQWRSAHEAILRDVDAHPGALRLAFEDVLGPADRQRAALGALSDWMGVPIEQELSAVLTGGLPLVMSTEQPRRRRWFARIDALAPLLADPPLLSLMERLGYARDPATWE